MTLQTHQEIIMDFTLNILKISSVLASPNSLSRTIMLIILTFTSDLFPSQTNQNELSPGLAGQQKTKHELIRDVFREYYSETRVGGVDRIKVKPCWVWLCSPVIPALGKPKQEDYKSEDRLDFDDETLSQTNQLKLLMPALQNVTKAKML